MHVQPSSHPSSALQTQESARDGKLRLLWLINRGLFGGRLECPVVGEEFKINFLPIFKFF